MTTRRCSCGFTTDDPGVMTDHELEVFAPSNDMGIDAQVHFEEVGRLACPCGFTASTITDMDEHFLRVFVPPSRLALDGVRHASATGAGAA